MVQTDKKDRSTFIATKVEVFFFVNAIQQHGITVQIERRRRRRKRRRQTKYVVESDIDDTNNVILTVFKRSMLFVALK